MPKPRGLPETVRMRHDEHYVDALTNSAGTPVGRIIPIDQLDPNPNQPRQVPASTTVGDQAECGKALDELGAPRGDDQVAGQRDVGARAGRDPIDPCDHRLRQARQRPDERVPAFLDGFAKIDRLAGRDRAVVQILPRAKAASGPGEDDDPRVAQIGERPSMTVA